MNSVVTQRFVKCHDQLKSAGIVKSSRQFALSLKYLPQSLSEIIQKRRDVPIELLRKAIEVYNLNPVYLFTGNGPFFMQEEERKDVKILTIVANSARNEQIIHVPESAISSYINGHHKPNFIKDLPTFSLPEYTYQTTTHRSFDVVGNAMEPILFESDKVICSYVDPTNWSAGIKDYYIYVIVAKGDIYIRRIVNKLRLENKIELFADNKSFAPMTLPTSDIKEIWHIRTKLSTLSHAKPKVKNHLKNRIDSMYMTLDEHSRLLLQIKNKINEDKG